MIYSMGFDEALVQRALARTGGNEQDAIEILIGGTGQLDLSPSLSSSRDASPPVIFSMGFDDALVRRALASAGGDEQRAVELLLSGRVPSSETSCSAPARVSQPAYADTSSYVSIPAPLLGSSPTAAMPGSASSSAPPSPAHNVATEWLDEDGRVCPKSVDYATQCPKGHALAPLVCSGDPQPQQTSDADVICRVCHGLTQRQHARDWLQCSVAACCGGYAVCAACVIELYSARGAAAASPDDFCMLVMLLACELKLCVLRHLLLWLCFLFCALTAIFRACHCTICSG